MKPVGKEPELSEGVPNHMAGGQLLRWWQEEEENCAAHEAIERVTPTSAPSLSGVSAATAEEVHDTWAELEAEAVRRVVQAKTEETESLSFCLDKATALRRHWRETRSALLLFVLMIAVYFIVLFAIIKVAPGYSRYLCSSGAFGAFVGALPGTIIRSFWRDRWLRNLNKPTVQLLPQGIRLHTQNQPNVFLPWSEVTSVTSKSFLKIPYLEFRGAKGRRFNVWEQDLPVAPEEVAAQIDAYKTARGIA